MNSAELAKMQYLFEAPQMETAAKLDAFSKSNEYCKKFDQKYEQLVIRMAAEKAHWDNIMLPLIKSGKWNSGMVPEAR